jgi:hypothetical protein
MKEETDYICHHVNGSKPSLLNHVGRTQQIHANALFTICSKRNRTVPYRTYLCIAEASKRIFAYRLPESFEHNGNGPKNPEERRRQEFCLPVVAPFEWRGDGEVCPEVVTAGSNPKKKKKKKRKEKKKRKKRKKKKEEKKGRKKKESRPEGLSYGKKAGVWIGKKVIGSLRESSCTK